MKKNPKDTVIARGASRRKIVDVRDSHRRPEMTSGSILATYRKKHPATKLSVSHKNVLRRKKHAKAA